MEPTKKINKLSLNQETVRKLVDDGPFSPEPNRALSVTICPRPVCTP